MNNEKLVELLKLIQEVNNIDTKEIKRDILHHISAYGAFLYYTGVISNKDFIKAVNSIKNDIEDKLYYEERNNYIEILQENNHLLNSFFRKSLVTYWNYQIKEQTDDTNIDIKNDFIKFLKYLNCYDLYNLIDKKGQIAKDSKILKHSVCLDNRLDSYIILKNKNTFYEYLDLSHEIAHALENKILSKYKRCFDSAYNAEILSITFNRIFIEYLYQNNRINYEKYIILLNNFETNYFNFIRLSLFISDSIYSGYYNINDYDISIFCESDIVNLSLTDYNYAIGRIWAFKLFSEWEKNDTKFIKEIPRIVEYIYHAKLKELINNVDNSDLLINNELSKNFIKK